MTNTIGVQQIIQAQGQSGSRSQILEIADLQLAREHDRSAVATGRGHNVVVMNLEIDIHLLFPVLASANGIARDGILVGPRDVRNGRAKDIYFATPIEAHALGRLERRAGNARGDTATPRALSGKAHSQIPFATILPQMCEVAA